MKNLRNQYWWEQIMKWMAKLIYRLKSLSFAKTILILYLFVTLIGALLLWAPVVQTGVLEWDPHTGTKTMGHVNFLNSLFTAASAFSDTGLSVHSAAVTYNELGQAIIAILIFIGGIGWFALKVYIINIIFGRPLSYKTSESLAAERGSVKIGVTLRMIRVVVSLLLVIMFIFAVVLSLIFYYTDVSGDQMLVGGQAIKSSETIYEYPYHNSMVALRYGFFHAISALNNAGFDIIGNSSLAPYYNIFSIQIVFIILFVLGGLGYPVIYDVYRYLITRKSGQNFRFSLFTKLSCVAYLVVSVLGLFATFLIEIAGRGQFWTSNEPHYGSSGHKVLAIFFNTMSTRNAGFSTVSMHDLSRGTLIVYMMMMFIGSAPSSTAGGIRTTTIAINVLGIWSLIRGHKKVYAFGRRIEQETVNKSFIVFVVSIMILLAGSLISLTSLDSFGGKIPTIETAVKNGTRLPDGSIVLPPDLVVYNFTEVVFEVGSAFGTTGLSTGITSLLSVYSKLALILIMFIGQLGVSSAILIWGSRRRAGNHYSRVGQAVSIG